MSNPAKSVFAFGIYLAVIGFVLIVAPNALFTLLGMPSTNEVWVRALGVTTCALAFYYIQAARAELADFFQWTVYTRPTLIVFFTIFVMLGLAGPILILFGVLDLLGAIWTELALRSSKRASKTA